ncbi:hypothetical protein INT44_002708 [Umbelopsis vinacea]|uniref:MYND-type domain-containing protein n=1 Tax=Umbelopsis vinacea TaxID=44442 RepID=A0A8H7UHW8_9FUNG|nr:hypothetical protein INT44_002708 [Umbelopsis vinacea]
MSRHSDIDDSASDSDVSELNNHDIGASSIAVTQLGFAEDPEEPLTAESFPSKSGGLPLWLNPEHILQEVICQVCEKPMNLLIQLYTPEDHPAEAYHRTVYVFCCKDGACHKKNWKKCFKVFRNQLPRENPYYSPSSESDSEDDDSWEPKQFEAPRLCSICGVQGTKTCGKCHNEHYCSREHQLADWTFGGHKQTCCQTLSDAQQKGITAKRRQLVFSEKEIVSEPEGRGEDGEEEDAQQEFSKEQNGATESRALVPAGDEIYENTEVDVDQAFLKFQLRVQLYPEQVIRYTRTEYGQEDAEPLWVSDKGKPDPKVDVPACSACGAERTFEFQILSTLLNFLGVSHVATDSLDWGSLYVYTCKDNCPTQSNYIEEVLWKQDFSEEGVQLPTSRPDAVRANEK